MDVLSSIITVFPGGDKFVVAKQTTGQWHVDAENPDDDVDLYESESRQQYAPVSEYLPTSAKHSKQLGGLEAMMAQELDSQLLAAGAVDKAHTGPFGLKDIVYPPDVEADDEKAEGDRTGHSALKDGRYRGEFEKGHWHGSGLLVHHNGDVYDGQFNYDVKHGKGTYITAATGSVFKGVWVDGLPEGEAEVRFENGEMYKGSIKRGGAFHGKGTYTWPDKSCYQGDWVEGLMHGQGRYKYANGDVYEGGFVSDKREGAGRLTEGAFTYDVLFERGVMIAYGKSVLGRKTGSSILIDTHLVTSHLAERNRRRVDMARNMELLDEATPFEFVPSVDEQSQARGSHSLAASVQRSREAVARLALANGSTSGKSDDSQAQHAWDASREASLDGVSEGEQDGA